MLQKGEKETQHEVLKKGDWGSKTRNTFKEKKERWGTKTNNLDHKIHGREWGERTNTGLLRTI